MDGVQTPTVQAQGILSLQSRADLFLVVWAPVLPAPFWTFCDRTPPDTFFLVALLPNV